MSGENKINSSLENLYNQAVIKNLVSWNTATNPTDDSYKAEEIVSMQFTNQLKSFVESNPEHPVSLFNKGLIFSEELEEEKLQISQNLWKKYQAMKKTKALVDQEYLDLFDSMVAVTKKALNEKGLSANQLMFFNDSKLGKPEFILSVVEEMANISKEFIKTKPKNAVKPINFDSFSLEKLIAFMEQFSDVDFKISDKNGSFMTSIDKDHSAIHISKNKKDMFDMSSSVTHEMGHALYQNRLLNKNTEIGKLGQCISLSLHESSSIIHEISLSGIDFNVRERVDNLYRLGTDKVHYIIHIYIRMKIEEMLFTDQITAKDVSGVWNALVEEYIGIKPNNDWEGFLQDVHWNSGAFGYFHSYAIGFFNAITMYADIKDSLTNDWYSDTNHIIIPKISNWYGNFNEYSDDILNKMHPDIKNSLSVYKDFIFNNFNYS